MSTALIGERRERPGTDETRVAINIDAGTRERLRNLLYLPMMRGVGWSEFIDRAVQRALEEADEQGADASGFYRPTPEPCACGDGGHQDDATGLCLCGGSLDR